VYSRISDASGHPLSPNSAPAVGDRLSFASNDYAGNHKHHAKQTTASDHIVCTLTSTSTAPVRRHDRDWWVADPW
jgi:hypothetical protein